MLAYKRTDRIGGLFRKEISSILQEEIKDPRIGFVTITKVVVTDDLSLARVFFSTINTGEERQRSIQGLMSASGYIKRVLGKRLKLKRIPNIVFKFDDTLEYSSHIEEVLKGIKDG